MNSKISRLFGFAVLCIMFASCSKDPETPDPVPGEDTSVKGFFLLNEGNMGSNKATIDYFDYESGTYTKNIFPTRNPDIAYELGDVGNDIQIYGGKLYAVINMSGLVEVMDVNTAKHIATIEIPNCRYITFDKGYAYVSSYGEANAETGCVARIDTAALTVKDRCSVGLEPEEMVVRDNKLYVANSGGYHYPAYDNTVSVVDLNQFKEMKKITVAVNLQRMLKDNYNNIYVTSNGNYGDVQPDTYVIGVDDAVKGALSMPASAMALCGDSILACSNAWSNEAGGFVVSYAVVNTKTQSVLSSSFITDGTSIAAPYGIAVNPDTKDILLTDTKDRTVPGMVYCFSAAGKKKWSYATGDIPAHIVFTKRKLHDLN